MKSLSNERRADVQLSKEAALGRVAGLLSSTLPRMLPAHERLCDEELSGSDVPRLGVLSDLERADVDRETQRASIIGRTIVKLSMLPLLHVCATERLLRDEIITESRHANH